MSVFARSETRDVEHHPCMGQCLAEDFDLPDVVLIAISFIIINTVARGYPQKYNNQVSAVQESAKEVPYCRQQASICL